MNPPASTDKAISVYEGDVIGYRADLMPEDWEACQRIVTAEEYARLQELTALYRELQDMLKEIRGRREWDGVDGKYEDE